MTTKILDDQTVCWEYQGLDHVKRVTQLKSDTLPGTVLANSMLFELSLPPQETKTFHITVTCSVEGHISESVDFSTAQNHAAQALRNAQSRFCSIYTGNEQFNDWINRSLDDICMMTTDLPHGLYPYAGVP